MAEILPRHYIIGIIIFTMFIVGGISIISIFNEADSSFINDTRFEQFNQSFNVLSNITSEVGNLEDSIVNADTDFGAYGVLNALISSAWQTLKLTFTSFSFMETAFAGLTSFFGIPSWIIGLVILIITVLFVFAIYSAIFQRDI